MRAVIQRVKSASVTVDSQVVSSIGRGLLVLVGVGHEDTEADIEKFANKVTKLRLWPNEDGSQQWRRSVMDVDGDIICVSQFTLFAKVKKGTKPDFHSAAKGQEAQAIYDKVLARIGELTGKKIGDGVFGAMMDVALVNDGPVTIEYDTKHER
ncbi:D-aminoacyl-tRNA deacylase [Trichomonascus vanleenenianus]|uniref:D-tyrosyl-tRNA(Tyr) deacylase n=1 Tax=Trichomonascus vanleenenianus TaxID=2268995 RepID=UPI003EC95F0D